MAHQRGRLTGRLWAGDEEMAKKDDDLGLPGHHRHSSQWQGARPPRRRALVRLFAYVVFIALLVLTILRFVPPSSDETNQATTPEDSDKGSKGFNTALSQARSQQERNYGGPIQFPELDKTLQNIAGTGGSSERNRNVLFATGSLRSAATLLPMACQMAANEQNHVHFVLISRSEIPMADLLKANGLEESCKLFAHGMAVSDLGAMGTNRLQMPAPIASLFLAMSE